MDTPETTPKTEAPAEAPKTEAPVEAPKAEKKGKKGLVIGCAVGVVALVGGGLGIAYAVSSSPENIALSAISDFISSKNIAVDGTIEISAKTKSSDLGDVKITLSNEKSGSNEANTSATISVNYGGKEYNVKLGSVVLKDYTLYVQVDGLKDAVKDAVKALGSSESSYQEYADLYEGLINDVVGEIDGVWWKISVPELVDEIDGIEDEQRSQIKEAYNCLISTADKASTMNDDYVKIYKDNAFVKIAKHDGSETFAGKGTAYDLTIDAAKLTSYANAMTESVKSLGLEDCMNKINDLSDNVSANLTTEEVKQEDVEKAIESLPEIVVTIDGGFFSHSLTGIYTSFDSAAYAGKVELTFKKENATVKEPEGAKKVTELYDNVMAAYENWQKTATCKVMKKQYPSYYTTYCDASTNLPKAEYEKYFTDSQASLLI